MQKTTQESCNHLYLNPHSIGNQISNPKIINFNHRKVHQMASMSTHPLFLGPKTSIGT